MTAVSKKTSVMKIFFSNEDFYQLETKQTEGRLGLWRAELFSITSINYIVITLTYTDVRSSIAEQNEEAALIL